VVLLQKDGSMTALVREKLSSVTPRDVCVGDVLANGWRITAVLPKLGRNFLFQMKLDDSVDYIEVSPKVPIALSSKVIQGIRHIQ
jgi:hypothetical protein